MTGSTDRGAFIWYELMTDDPAGAKAFYDAVVGWTIQAQGNAMPNGSEYRMIGRSDGGHAAFESSAIDLVANDAYRASRSSCATSTRDGPRW